MKISQILDVDLVIFPNVLALSFFWFGFVIKYPGSPRVLHVAQVVPIHNPSASASCMLPHLAYLGLANIRYYNSSNFIDLSLQILLFHQYSINMMTYLG